MKLLKEYAREVWHEAADTCQDCGARYEVRVEEVDGAGEAGIVRVRAPHREACDHGEDDHQREEAGWSLTGGYLTFLGQDFALLDGYLDVLACVGCERFIVTMPLLVFAHAGLLAFCHSCARQWGIVGSLRSGRSAQE
jgi:hypothetical protein